MAWFIRGKSYDLSQFQHPGGPIALALAKGRDADLLVRSYHPFNEKIVRKVLEKYVIQDDGKFIVIATFKFKNLLLSLFYYFAT